MKKHRDLGNVHEEKNPPKQPAKQTNKKPAASNMSCQSHNCAKVEIACSAEPNILV